jgi:hypothetical protein
MTAQRTSSPSLGVGIAAALVLSSSGAAVLAALAPMVGAGTALRAVVALLGFAYVLYTLHRSGERIGRITVVVLWLAAAAATWIAPVPFTGYVLIHVGILWLVRSLYLYSGVLPALGDLALSALGIAFAVWAAQRSGSAALALWCFFLTQAFHVLIPAAIPKRAARLPSDDDQAFTRAHRAAEAAVRRLSAVR